MLLQFYTAQQRIDSFDREHERVKALHGKAAAAAGEPGADNAAEPSLSQVSQLAGLVA